MKKQGYSASVCTGKMTTVIRKGTSIIYRLYPIVIPRDMTAMVYDPYKLADADMYVNNDMSTIIRTRDTDIRSLWLEQVKERGLPMYQLPAGSPVTYGYLPAVTTKPYNVHVFYEDNATDIVPYEEYRYKGGDGMLVANTKHHAWTGTSLDLYIWDEQREVVNQDNLLGDLSLE